MGQERYDEKTYFVSGIYCTEFDQQLSGNSFRISLITLLSTERDVNQVLNIIWGTVNRFWEYGFQLQQENNTVGLSFSGKSSQAVSENWITFNVLIYFWLRSSIRVYGRESETIISYSLVCNWFC